MAANDSGRQSGFDGLVAIIAACCIAAGVVAAVWVALLTGNDMRGRVDAGVPWAAIVAAGLGAMALTVCALVVIWSIAMARGSSRRNRHVALLRAYGVEVDERGKEPRLGAASC